MIVSISPNGNNSGSCGELANYLDKEVQGEFFSHDTDGYTSKEVTEDLDQHRKGQLAARAAKFYEISYSPSHEEQQHMIFKATGKEDIQSLDQLNRQELQATKVEFQKFIRAVQDEQAKLYGRDSVNSGADLKYYAKIETQRTHKGFDPEVKYGSKKQGMRKDGLHLHAHIIQSRKAADKKTLLSPNANSKQRTNKVLHGFNRTAFYTQAEKAFDRSTGYERSVSDTFEYKNAASKNEDLTKFIEQIPKLAEQQEQEKEQEKAKVQEKTQDRQRGRGMGR